jgi:hypothetical protein
MDILASIFAYMVCMTGLLTGLIVSFVVFFSTPSQQAEAPTRAIAMVATPSSGTAVKQFAAKELPVKTVASAQQTERGEAVLANAAAAQVAVALDARQKSLLPPNRMRRLAAKERARHLAYRERSSFEARFLHYDD